VATFIGLLDGGLSDEAGVRDAAAA
jgi:hypothetical protein